MYCPRTVASPNWINRLLDWDIYERSLAPHFDMFETVYLQGWGEPLTNPRFWDMVELAKKGGCRVGFTTNGIMLDAAAAERACRLEVDIVTFTFAGPTADTHQFYRGGGDFAGLTDTIRLLAETRKRLQAAKPAIGITYTMMRDNMRELPDAVRLAAALGADQMTCGHLDCIADPALEAHAVFLGLRREDEEVLSAAAGLARQAGLIFDAEPPHMGGEILVCEPYPLRVTLFVRADGVVVPCHAMALRPEAVERLYFKGMPHANEPIILGDLRDQTLPDILSGKACGRLREIFGTRGELDLPSGSKIPEAPAACGKCYKLYGV